ncbi:MAG: SseB family protein [Muricoprocola sp.]
MKDKELQGNEKIEECIAKLKQELTEENLAVTLTAIRRRMKEKGQMVVPIEAPAGTDMKIRVMRLNGKNWLGVFTSFEEELKGSDSVMSTFMADIEQILDMGLKEPTLEGVIINPWGDRLALDKTLLRVIKGENDK